MVCSSCGSENRAGRRFCSQCGAPLELRCASCGAANDAEDAFNQYLRAANLWGECAGTAGCAASSIESRLQHRWKVASKSLDAAKQS